jgi:hypothetical protein
VHQAYLPSSFVISYSVIILIELIIVTHLLIFLFYFVVKLYVFLFIVIFTILILVFTFVFYFMLIYHFVIFLLFIILFKEDSYCTLCFNLIILVCSILFMLYHENLFVELQIMLTLMIFLEILNMRNVGLIFFMKRLNS